VNPYVRDRINRKLDTLSDERLYQVLDYVEFIEARYAEKPAVPANVFQRFADGVEDKLRAGGVAASTVAETMGLLGKAMNVLNGVAQTTMTVATDVVTKARNAADQVGAPAAPPASSSTPAAPASGTQTAPPPSPTSAPGMPPGPATPPEAAA
jgi:hypothetical protein